MGTVAVKVKDSMLGYTEYDQIILIDHEHASRGMNYQRAVVNTEYIGVSNTLSLY